MTRNTPMTPFLFASRREVARRIVIGALAGRPAMLPPLWFALLTWCDCLAGPDVRCQLFARTGLRRDR